MMIFINKSPFTRFLSVFILINFLFGLFSPTAFFALTSGPAQPEALGFHSAGNNQLVDPFTGKFSYNIPVISVGDYPLNLSYNTNITMDQEASWVGLGWNLNVGQITRNMRGLPDDFNGDQVKKEFNIKENITVGGIIGRDLEIAGLEKLKALKLKAGFSLDLRYNNYSGISIGQSISAGIGARIGSETNQLGLMGSMALSTSSEGLNIQPNLSFQAKGMTSDEKSSGALSAGYGIAVNSRSGLQQRTLSASLSPTYSNKSIYLEPGSASYGTTTLYGPVAFTPQLTLPFSTTALSFSVKVGVKIKAAEPGGKLAGYFSKQKLNLNSTEKSAYGFCYLENGQKSNYALLDFNREKDAAFIPGCPNLPLTYLTHDVFSVGAQGIEGTYRAYRNNTGYVYDSRVDNGSNSSSLGAEVSLGDVIKGGADFTTVSINSTSHVWEKNNSAYPSLIFKKKSDNNPIHHVYFKKIGDVTNGVNSKYFENSGGNNPVKFQLSGTSDNLDIGCDEKYVGNGNGYKINGSVIKFDQPVASSETFAHLSVEQVNLSGSYHKTKYLAGSPAKNHHIGQITINDSKGKRYVFGLPAYNHIQKEVSFSVNPVTDNNHLVAYTGVDNSILNKNGLDHFFSSTTIPPFAYAWYLTDVLSADYVDITGDGPSIDDYGNYVRFHSGKKIPEYKWRTPFQQNRAQYDEQLLSLPGDDKGHYIYGKRDVWYIDSITSKTQIAIFYSSPRNDAFEVNDENGGIGDRSLLKLDSIALFNLHDYNLLKEKAFPLVAVHFVYDYSLCKGIPNYKSSPGCSNSNFCGGKLSLKELYFTYGNSYKGRYSGYKFSYSNEYPSYSMVNYDRWGIYKTNNPGLPNYYFPYSISDKPERDKNVASWLLEKIQLPTGGYIKMDYESDDYNYVQDKKAMRMFRVAGVSDSQNSTGLSTELYGNPFLFFDLEEFSGDYSVAMNAMYQMINQSVSENLYFKFKVNVAKNESVKDFVYGYCQMASLTDYGVKGIDGKFFGWIKLKEVNIDDPGSNTINPISRAAIQFCRLNTPVYAFNQVSVQNLENNPVEALKDILNNASIINQIIDFSNGPNGSLMAKNIGKSFDNSQSWIRLGNPGNKKTGGGARVKKLTFSNNWNVIQGNEPEQIIEQEYFYELENGFSSGVASYEPLIGADEIPHHLPINYNEAFANELPKWARTLAPHNSYIKEEPFGEMAFPPAEIGYSRVVVKNKIPDGLNSPGTGYTVYDFYTAKDFPVITKRTPINAERRKWQNKFTVFNKKIKDYMTVTQGYSIELNNMHGKPKKTTTFNASGSIINSSINEYFTLGNGVKILNRDGTVTLDTLGLEEDMVVDFREQATNTETESYHANIGAFMAGIIPIIIPFLYPVTESEKLRFRSATTTRIIYKYGIPKKQIVTDLGAKVETENLVFDPITGIPILTRTNNQYIDPVYSFSYPAHYIYNGMASAGLNSNTYCKIFTNGNGGLGNQFNFLTGGDELMNLSSGEKYWVREIGSNKYLINSHGQSVAGLNGINSIIIRSGHRNQCGLSAGEITCLENPMVSLGLNKWKLNFSSSSKIINSSASTFTEGYKENCFNKPATNTCQFTPLGFAMQNFFNELMATPGCLFLKNTDIYNYNNNNSIINMDTILINHFKNQWVDSTFNLLRWENKAISPTKWEATIFLAGGYQPLCHFTFNFSCPVTSSLLSAVFCNKNLLIQFDENCNPFAAFSCVPLIKSSVNSNPSNVCCDSLLIMEIQSGCFPFFNPVIAPSYECGNAVGGTVNPYRQNILGAWYNQNQYVKITDRVPSSSSNPVNLRTDGYFENFNPFWNYQVNAWAADTNGWTRANTNTITDPDGNALESIDALDRHSSTILGYNNQLPVANAVNARYREIATENFEDYYPGYSYRIPQNNTCYHFKFSDYSNNIALDTAHTGHYSIRISPGEKIIIERPVTGIIPCAEDLPSGTFGANSPNPFLTTSCNCTGIFSPIAGQSTRYVMSYWQKSVKYPGKNFIPPNYYLPVSPIIETENLIIEPQILVDNFPISLQLVYTSEEIEGWKKVEYEFTVPPSALNSIQFRFSNPGIGGVHFLYMDDFRIHPYNSTLKTFVYDPFSHRLMSILDENNFASTYQYDQEGNLQEVIRETERGRVFREYYKKELGLKE